MRLLALLGLGLLFVASSLAEAADAGRKDRHDGDLLSKSACQPKKLAYADWVELQALEYSAERDLAREHGVSVPAFSDLRPKLETEAEFSHRRAYAGFKCERLVYASGGLAVVALVWRPDNVADRHLPLVIFNRGGGQDLGKLVPWERDGFFDFLEAGFVVIGTQYRGNDGGEGHDEEGGAETRDVVSLISLAKTLGYIDMRNVFMVGESRGAMMTYLAMREGVRVNAAAVIGSETDLAANLARRPELLEGYEKAIPGFTKHRQKVLRDRSAQFWPEAISAPLLILHGGKDWRVPPAQDLAFAAKLEALHTPYELIVFEGGVHLLTFHWRERDQRIIHWFQMHMAGEATGVRRE